MKYVESDEERENKNNRKKKKEEEEKNKITFNLHFFCCVHLHSFSFLWLESQLIERMNRER